MKQKFHRMEPEFHALKHVGITFPLFSIYDRQIQFRGQTSCLDHIFRTGNQRTVSEDVPDAVALLGGEPVGATYFIIHHVIGNKLLSGKAVDACYDFIE